MQHLEVSGAVRHIYIYIYVVRQLRVKWNTYLASVDTVVVLQFWTWGGSQLSALLVVGYFKLVPGYAIMKWHKCRHSNQQRRFLQERNTEGSELRKWLLRSHSSKWWPFYSPVKAKLLSSSAVCCGSSAGLLARQEGWEDVLSNDTGRRPGKLHGGESRVYGVPTDVVKMTELTFRHRASSI